MGNHKGKQCVCEPVGCSGNACASVIMKKGKDGCNDECEGCKPLPPPSATPTPPRHPSPPPRASPPSQRLPRRPRPRSGSARIHTGDICGIASTRIAPTRISHASRRSALARRQMMAVRRAPRILIASRPFIKTKMDATIDARGASPKGLAS
ncbi:hypothetical protein K469DRAFT_103999 [Zopfia rhizophila CBS 207.26]|uniref:Uncharacterized protein n=1 Tax=Zopfia rhizophila CBS 207.26 TaxID=1314779 RepID=A0A6A6E6X2_9PEZI|nr:hypothetical protein K469DRAFT_103999 [Zopfia rhizophila CBS 207.26]